MRKLLCFVLVLLLCISSYQSNAETYVVQQIVFSNISSDSVTSDPLPKKYNQSPIYNGIATTGFSLIDINDLKNVLGCTVSIDSTGNKWSITRNGMTTVFTKDSTAFSSSLTYSIKDLSTTPATTITYTKTFSGTTRTKSVLYNGKRYVDLRRASEQLGALIVGYDSANSQALVFDWRVSGSTPLQDDNTYLVGGNWITNWSTYGSTKAAPHFKINEIWDKSTSSNNPDGYNTLKMSIKQIQCLENVRKYYLNNSSMQVASAFRTWKYNHLVGGSKTSIHMRGRAWDAPDDTLYAKVKTEFCGSYSTPINLSTEMWGSRVYPSGNSGGYRLEKMAPDYPRDGIWLHLDTPRTGTVN